MPDEALTLPTEKLTRPTEKLTRPTEKLTRLAREIVAVIEMLAPGEVVSYGDIAHDAGHPGAARAVGALLASTPSTGYGVDLPWWRVVRSDGRLVTSTPSRQARLLRAEGVTVSNNRVTNAPSGRFARR